METVQVPKLAFVNGDFFTPSGVVSDKSLLISEEGKVLGFSSTLEPLDVSSIDLQGLNVGPGLVDLQVNGAGGEWVWQASDIAALEVIDQTLLRSGVTRWCPTYISPTREEVTRAMGLAKAVLHSDLGVVGWHFEGPWIAHQRRGAHPLERIRALTDSELASLMEMSKIAKVILTVAPELVPSDIVSELARHGVSVFAGHSLGVNDDYVRFFEAGGSGITHIGNASGLIESRQSYGWGALVKHPVKSATVIADGLHVDPIVLTILKRSLGQRQLSVVSDLIAGSRSQSGSFSLFSETCTHAKDGSARTADGKLAGSLATIFDALRTLVQRCGIPLDEALRMCSTYPASVLGIASDYGSLRQDAICDLVTFSNYFVIREVYRCGKLVFSVRS